ncbi:MAG: tRNA dihydrouridine(20/20a) synthase DusA [Pseudomonadota bacterium]
MLDRTLSIAPMMGCTDRHCRYLFRLLSDHALLYSEMVVTGALLYGRTSHFLDHAGDEPCALQLGGSNPSELRTCARLAESAGYQEVNLNVGCPSDKVQNGGIGACLMAEPALVADCVAAMASAVEIPVTVKCRIGIDDKDSFEFFADFVDTVHAAGCRVFIVHARSAILAGLSPKENREIPPLKYDYVFRIREAFPDTTFVLNGGLNTLDDVNRVLPQTDGVMLGRAPYANPWLLTELEQALYGTAVPDRLAVLAEYQQYIDRAIADGHHFKHMAKHLLGYFTGCRGARAFRRYMSGHMFTEQADSSILERALAEAGLDESPTVARTGTDR